MSKTKLFLTGANGFLNSRVNKTYKNKYDIIPTDIEDLDITNHQQVEEVLKEVKPDIILHAAAMAGTQQCEDNPNKAHQVNVEAPVNIARIASQIGAKLLFISSEQVFNGNKEAGPYEVDDKAVPNTVYGETKLKAEGLLRKEIEDLWILRFSWLFGFPERNTANNPNLFWRLITAVLKDNPVKVADNEYRGITYVYDLIDNLPRIFKLPYGTYHFGSENDLSTYQISTFMLREMGVARKVINRVVIKDEEKYKERSRDLRLSYKKTKANKIPIRSSQESIKRAVEEFDFKIR